MDGRNQKPPHKGGVETTNNCVWTVGRPEICQIGQMMMKMMSGDCWLFIFGCVDRRGERLEATERKLSLSRTHVNLDGWTENCIPLCPLGSDVDVVVKVVILVTRILIIIIPSKNNVTIHFLLISKLFSWVDSSVTEEGEWKNRRGWERDGLQAPLGRLWIVIQLVVVDVLIVIVILLYGTPNPGVLFCEIGCRWHCLLWYEGTHASSCLSWMAEWIDVGLSCTLPKLYRSGWEMLWKGSI